MIFSEAWLREYVNPAYSSRAVARVLEKYGLLKEAIAIYELAEQRQPKLNVSFERAQLYAQLRTYLPQYGRIYGTSHLVVPYLFRCRYLPP